MASPLSWPEVFKTQWPHWVVSEAVAGSIVLQDRHPRVCNTALQPVPAATSWSTTTASAQGPPDHRGNKCFPAHTNSLPADCTCQPGNETFPRDQYKWNRNLSQAAAARLSFFNKGPPEDIAFL